ncbi:MAG: signal recognition particle-docking protein FtsY [Alphaproteobacteria bacterium]|nr:signal recognition particle-docking protein FtsY [Alphaproteobacteria bacterium]
MSWFGDKSKAEQRGWFGRLSEGLKKSSQRLVDNLDFTRKKLDQEALDALEDVLVRADMGPTAAARIVAGVAESRFGKDVSDAEVKEALAEEIEKLLKPREGALEIPTSPKPRVVLVIGVNGSGKTTTIGKLAARLREDGKTVVVAAADTFRAAAIEQLEVWAKRAGADFVAKGAGADSAGVAYDAVARAQETSADVVLIDTAGRLQNKAELMAELPKIVRVIRKLDEDAPHDALLVLDATVGQNALSQMEAFRSAIDLTGLVLTKLDGTAKGGVLVAIAARHAVPVTFIGVGEAIDDLQPFDAAAFSRALVGVA